MKKTALLFSGQGSQYIGMGKSLFESFTEAHEVFEEANETLGFDLKKLCFEGSLDELTKTENTQPAILTVSVAAFRAYMKEIGIQPVFTAGHSLGEFSALSCSGSITFPDALKIVRQRGKFMQEAVAQGIGGMAAVSGVSEEQIEVECKSISEDSNLVVISNYNSPSQIVISGHLIAINRVSEKLSEMGAQIIPLKVSSPFHSPLMQEAADRLNEELLKYKYYDFKYPVISNITAQPYPDKNCIIEYLTKQIVQPVKWQYSMEYMRQQGVEISIELGPGTVLRNLMGKNAHGIKSYSYDADSDALRNLNSENSGNNINLAVITKCIAAAVCTKNSNWNEEEYQKGVVEPYKRITGLKEEIENGGRQATDDEVKQALDMLKSVFKTKKTPEEEQTERLNKIIDTGDLKGKYSEYLTKS